MASDTPLPPSADAADAAGAGFRPAQTTTEPGRSVANRDAVWSEVLECRDLSQNWFHQNPEHFFCLSKINQGSSVADPHFKLSETDSIKPKRRISFPGSGSSLEAESVKK